MPDQAAGLRDEHDVHVPPLPGLGGAPRHPHPSIDAYADVIAAGIERLPVRRVVLGGVSMGGYVALALAARRPALVAGLALVDTQAEADDEAARAGRGACAARGRGVPVRAGWGRAGGLGRRGRKPSGRSA